MSDGVFASVRAAARKCWYSDLSWCKTRLDRLTGTFSQWDTFFYCGKSFFLLKFPVDGWMTSWYINFKCNNLPYILCSFDYYLCLFYYQRPSYLIVWFYLMYTLFSTIFFLLAWSPLSRSDFWKIAEIPFMVLLVQTWGLKSVRQ